ncbi:hypothetical protein PIROE2DRAFT_15372 [Piromyces sp. E2]|nr:hypothetical protein PIROE2DRAFT_15372 [Piromyces sp. E2]|eukprot:OUM59176.1 hypothetical protein PIROE2DRAFT_15372 [Piromyces sp. E2]
MRDLLIKFSRHSTYNKEKVDDIQYVKPIIFVSILHWFFSATGDIYNKTINLREYDVRNIYPYRRDNWKISFGYAYFFWIIAEIFVKQKNPYAFSTRSDTDIKYDDIKDIILSLIYALKSGLLQNMEHYKIFGKISFFEKFNYISEFRIIASMIVVIIYPVIERYRQMVYNFNYNFMYMDQILIFICVKRTQKTTIIVSKMPSHIKKIKVKRRKVSLSTINNSNISFTSQKTLITPKLSRSITSYSHSNSSNISFNQIKESSNGNQNCISDESYYNVSNSSSIPKSDLNNILDDPDEFLNSNNIFNTSNKISKSFDDSLKYLNSNNIFDESNMFSKSMEVESIDILCQSSDDEYSMDNMKLNKSYVSNIKPFDQY